MPDLLGDLDTVISSLATVDAHGLSDTDLLDETETLLATRNTLDGLIAVRLQAADVRDVTVAECGRTTRSWLVEDQHLSPAEASRRMWVARRLPAHPQLADLLLAGRISHDHAQLIINCVTKLPVDWREPAENELCEFATANDPATLARLCAALRVRSGADEDAEAAEARRHAARQLTVSSTFDGMIHLDGMLDPESGAILQAALTPLVATPTGPEDTRTTSQRRADALTDLARFSLTHADLPDHGGERPQVIVTIPYTELRDGINTGQLGHATLNGTPVTPTTARRLACDANLIPAILGTHSEILDLGRTRRSFSRAQRRAAALRDHGCTFPRCQTPLARCDLHHLNHWEHGGPTNHTNSAYLCAFHHWLIHHTNWTITRNTHGTIEISRT
jgi:hypothetical protein